MRTTLRYPVYRLQLTTAAVTLPVSLPEVKARLDKTSEADDPELIAQIRVATTNLENYCRRTFVDTTFTMFLDRFPGKALPWWDGVRQMADTELTDLTEAIMIPLPPLDSITSIKANKQDGTTTTVTSTDYIVDTASEPGRVALKMTKSWPTDSLQSINGVEVLFVAGYGPVGSDVPEPIREAIMVCVTDMNSNKSGETLKFEKVGDSSLSRFGPDETGSIIPRQARNLLSGYRVWKV